MLEGKIKFAKVRLGCRYSVHLLAETFHGKVRQGISGDGISYFEQSPHLSFRLVFGEESQAEDFESQVARVPQKYRKRTLEESSEVAPDIEVQLSAIQKIVSNVQLVRVKADHYEKITGDTEVSPEYDIMSNSLTSVVDITEETKLRLVEREDSWSLFRMKPQKCHLISQSLYKEPPPAVRRHRLIRGHVDVLPTIHNPSPRTYYGSGKREALSGVRDDRGRGVQRRRGSQCPRSFFQEPCYHF